MRRSNKGFTLVELVIVIAVIAILAGVMIATFAGVVNDAKKAAAEQEAAQAEQNQKIEDITAKLENADWLAWEDFESYLENIDSEAATKADVSVVVEEALKAYAEAAGKDETGLTEEQIATIIQREMAGALSATQVEGIVANAVKGIKIPDSITVNDVARAVNSALASTSFVTENDVYSAVVSALGNFKLSNTDVNKIADAVAATTLKADEVEALLHKYYRNGVSGDYTWYDPAKTTHEVTTAAQVQAIAGLAAEGNDFTGETITIKGDLDFSAIVWAPIANFNGTITGGTEGATLTGITLTPNTTVADSTILDCGSTGNNDKYGLGFINYLGKDGVLENVTLVVDFEITTTAVDGIQVGGAVGYLDGGIIRNVTVEGYVSNFYRAGGIVGAAASGTIENCVNKATVESTCDRETNYSVANGIVAFVRNFADKTKYNSELTIKNCSNEGTLVGGTNMADIYGTKSGSYHNSVKVTLVTE